ncbi:MAG: hypothetical protein V8R10_02640 [Christensenellales bacterium]
MVILRCWWLDVARCGNSSRAASCLSSYIIIRKRNFAKTDCRAAVSRNHPANRLILRYFPALG